MKKLRLIVLIIVSFQIFGCLHSDEHYTVELKSNPSRIESRKPAELTFQVKDPNGKNFSDLEIIHEKTLHLFLISEDLSQFFHEHPTRQTDGSYKLPFTFPNGGKFKAILDFKPKGAEQSTEGIDVEVAGEKPKAVELVPETNFEKTIDGLKIQMKPSGELAMRKDLMLNFQAFDAETNQPANDLQNYLGEKAHFVIVRKGLTRFVHAHPVSGDKMGGMDHSQHDMSNMKMDEMSEKDKDSKVAAMVNFPNSGIYKVFAQFKRNEKIITVPFVFEVK